MPVSKISVAIAEGTLRAARKIAKAEGLSLSALVSRALERQLEEQSRLDAARALWATWDAASTPTPEDRDAFRKRIQRPTKRRRRAA